MFRNTITIFTTISHHIQGYSSMIDILEKISSHRKERNWTEYELAKRSDLPQSTISSWYRKNMQPSLISLDKIAKAFGQRLDHPLPQWSEVHCPGAGYTHRDTERKGI